MSRSPKPAGQRNGGKSKARRVKQRRALAERPEPTMAPKTPRPVEAPAAGRPAGRQRPLITEAEARRLEDSERNRHLYEALMRPAVRRR